MSVARRGTSWAVRYRDDSGRHRSRSFKLKEDADAFEAKVTLAKRRGDVSELDAGKQTLKAFTEQWWTRYALTNLGTKARADYRRLKDSHVIPKLGHLPLRRVTTERVQEFQATLLAENVGHESVRKTVAMLQGIMQRAVEWGRVPRNPVKDVRKLPQASKRTVIPLSPSDVERLRADMIGREWGRDAVLVSVLAYAGLRPGEALALRWGDVGAKAIIVDKAISLGEEKSTKTRSNRTVRLLAPLKQDLSAWRKVSGTPAQSALVFPRPDGEPWKDTDFRNWRRRRFDESANSAGLGDVRPYDLRHSFASLLLHEQANPAEVAAQLGHGLETLLGTYAHVIEDWRGRKPIKAEVEIAKARQKVSASTSSTKSHVRKLYASGTVRPTRPTKRAKKNPA